MAEIKHTHTPVRQCCNCGVAFSPTGNGYRCRECRRVYDAAWRVKRRAEGKPTGGFLPREYYKKYSEAYYQREENKQRRNELARQYTRDPRLRPHHEARWTTRSAIASGRLVRQPCEVCGATPADAHHDDYSRPLDVRWLCPGHHRELHKKAEGSNG